MQEINLSSIKAQHNESTKFSRIFKNQVAKSSAGFASNLTGLASATLGSATSSGRHHGTDDEASDREQEVAVPDNSLTTSNIDRFVSLIKSGRDGIGAGRVGDLWLGRVGNGMDKHWQWDTSKRLGPPRPPAVKRRSTHDDLHSVSREVPSGYRHVSAELPRTGSISRVDRPRYSDPAERRHRTRASLSHGAGHFKNMTSKTGHALRDGLSTVTSRAR
jgi:hypothetical protein